MTATAEPGRSILYVITDLEVGGVPLHLLRLVAQVRGRGWQPLVVSLSPPGPIADRIRSEGVEVLSCDGRHGTDLRVVARLAAIMRARCPDVVHALLFHAGLAARIAGRLSQTPPSRIICEIQTVEVERRWHLWVDALSYAGCRTVIGNSPSVVDHLARAGIPDSHLTLVRGGIDPAKFEDVSPASRSSLGLPENSRIVLWVGRLDPVKGLDHGIAAFAHVARGNHAHLVLIGDGPQRRELDGMVTAAGLTDRVHFAGVRDDIPALLALAELFVFPSRTEGLPNALLEAMAAGLPVVTTDVAGCRDLVRHGENGLLVPYGDRHKLAGAMTSLLNDRKLAHQLGQKAHDDVATTWSFERMIDNYESIYNAVLAEHPG